MTRTNEPYDVVVLGAGMSGLVGSSVLLDQGVESVAVIDEYDHVGGNHIDVEIEGYSFDIGSLIFQDDSPLLTHFPELMDRYQVIDPTWSRLNPQGVVTEYPFSLRDDVLAAGPVEIARIALSALAGRMDRRSLRTADDFARRALGRRFLRRSGLEFYMERFCGCPIGDIDLSFARSRMAWIGEETRWRAMGRRLWDAISRRPPPPPENVQLARPRSGFATLYAPAVASLEQRGVVFHLGRQLRGVRQVADGFEVETDAGAVRARRVVSTIPVARATALAGLEVPRLPVVTLFSLFYSFAGRRGFADPILYNFSEEARWKRLTVYSDFYGAVDGREYLTVEVVGMLDGSTTPESAAAEFRRHTAANDLLDGDLRLEGHHVLDQAYPIFTAGSSGRAAAGVTALREIGIESFGRQGAFQYQPTARVSTLEAESALGSPRQ